MAAEDLKHLFALNDKENNTESNDLDILDELSFATRDNTQSMSFENLPKNNVPNFQNLNNANSSSDIMLKLITSRLDKLESKIDSSQNSYKVDTLVELRITDHKITSLLQRILSKSSDSKQEVMAIKKLLNDLVKKAS